VVVQIVRIGIGLLAGIDPSHMPLGVQRRAHNLYNHLRTLDRAGCAKIFVQSLPQDERWAAILDRLQRASGLGDDSLELSVS